MRVEKDFKELLKLFNKNRVNFVIVGAYALAFHGRPRYTGDMDILVEPSEDNAKKILSALKKFGFGSLNLKASAFLVPRKVVQLGVPPVRIDLVTSLTGISWEVAYKNRVHGKYGNVKVAFIGKKEFLKNKKATSRLKDLADMEALGEE